MSCGTALLRADISNTRCTLERLSIELGLQRSGDQYHQPEFLEPQPSAGQVQTKRGGRSRPQIAFSFTRSFKNRYTQICAATGTVVLDGKTTEATDWHAIRDHSWGVLSGMGPAT
jgi:hypothetical protein